MVEPGGWPVPVSSTRYVSVRAGRLVRQNPGTAGLIGTASPEVSRKVCPGMATWEITLTCTRFSLASVAVSMRPLPFESQ
jgi:hypothetical protein